jgi:competence protein ComEC
VIAISGGNIAILAGLALLALAVLGVRGGPAAGVTLLVVLAFSLIVTAGPSVWRATLMAIVTLAARAIDHRTPSWHAVAVAAGAMVVARPLDVTNPGFILTFGATVALVEAARRVRLAAESPAPIPAAPTSRRRVRAALRLTWTQWVLPSIAASAAVELVLMPVSAHAFSRITVAGLVLNLTAVPLMALVQSAGLALSIADRWPIVAEPAAWVAARGASALVESARLVDVMPWLAWRVPPPSPVVMVVYYAGLGVWLFATGGRRLAGGLVLGITALAIAGGATWPSASARHQATMRLTVFDVGQAEALLLEVPDAEPMVVDAGGAPFGNPGSAIGSRVLAPALWARGITAVHTLLVTHGDPDHLGGAGALIGDFAPARLWTGIDVPSHRPMQDLLEQARRRGVAPTALRAGDVHEWGRARIRVLHPPEPDWERPRVRNDDSVVIEVLYDDTAVLLTGDVGQDVERAVLPQLSHARHRILKVAHHGSRTSTSQELLDGWRPGIAVISCGRGNRFGHPAAEVIARLQASGARVLRTDRDGQITIESDGRSVRVRTFMERAR